MLSYPVLSSDFNLLGEFEKEMQYR